MSFFSYVPGGTSYGSRFPSKKERESIDRANKSSEENRKRQEETGDYGKCGRDTE